MPNNLTFYEFFAGGGMARAGLGGKWHCSFANDFDPMKAETYKANWGGNELVVEDVNRIEIDQLPGHADLAWASFPCQDLSLAGNRAGIGRSSSQVQTRSGTFWPFWKLMQDLGIQERSPKVVVLENVYGTISSRGGRDFAAICKAFALANYKFGAAVIDARYFLPHSRPRVFFVATHPRVAIPPQLISAGPNEPWHPVSLQSAQSKISRRNSNWIWWDIAPPPAMKTRLVDLIEDDPAEIKWHCRLETERLISMMSPLNLAKLAAAQKISGRVVGCIYKRTREGKQRAEIRFDGIAGCLRTPGGGSSRQTVMVVEGKHLRSRLLSPREAARLMGLAENYILPQRYNDAYRVAGDGVVVPVVRHIAKSIVEPILMSQGSSPRAVA